nr:hypothetical protein [Bacillus pumilus]
MPERKRSLCLVQAGGWITFHHQKPAVFVFATVEEKQTYMNLLAAKVAEAKKEESRRRETMEANYNNPQMLAQSE